MSIRTLDKRLYAPEGDPESRTARLTPPDRISIEDQIARVEREGKIHMTYTDGFEIFWLAWKDITKKTGHPKKPAFAYWKRDRLEGREDELVEILRLQEDYRAQCRIKGTFVPSWPYCQRWLNEARYEFAPRDETKAKTVKSKPAIEICTPEQRQAIRRELAGVGKIEHKTGSFEDKRQETLRNLRSKK